MGFILALGLILAATGSSWRFDNAAHLGGFGFGLGAGFLASFGARARGSPAVLRAWDLAAIGLSLATALSFVPPALAVVEAFR